MTVAGILEFIGYLLQYNLIIHVHENIYIHVSSVYTCSYKV